MSSILPHIETPDYAAISDAFAQELQSASVGRPSSLSFITHQLPKKPLLTKGIVQGIVIGGTNYLLSTEKLLADGSRTVIERKTGILPTFATKDILVQFFKDHMDQRADAIGINFAFPIRPVLSPTGALDAELIAGTKEHTFIGLNEPIGQLAASIFHQYHNKRIPVSIANDTICLTVASRERLSGSIIVGTGFNMALRHTLLGTDVIVNLEAGNFNKFVSFETLDKIDKHSQKPKEMLFEKCVSGKYLFQHFNLLMEVFGLIIPPLQTSLELSALANGDENQPETQLSRQIITRSARLVTSAIIGVYNFLGQPKSMQLIGDGNLLWTGWHYQETIKKQFEDFGISKNVIEINHITDSNINGAIGLLTRS